MEAQRTFKSLLWLFKEHGISTAGELQQLQQKEQLKITVNNKMATLQKK